MASTIINIICYVLIRCAVLCGFKRIDSKGSSSEKGATEARLKGTLD